MFKNLTPHELTVYRPGYPSFTTTAIPPSGEVARVSTGRRVDSTREGFTLYRVEYGEVFGLPTEISDTTYIVSGMVAAHPDVKGRPDVVSPGELVRDDKGKVVGCMGFALA